MTIRNTMHTTGVRLLLAGVLALSMAVAFPLAAFGEPADDTAQEAQEQEAQEAQEAANPLPPLLKGDSEIEKLSTTYREAQTAMNLVDARCAKLQARVDELVALLPVQQKRSDESMRQTYILLSDPLVVVESLLSSATLDDFIRQSEYLERISLANVRELNRTKEMKEKIEATQAEALELRARAEERLVEVRDALTEEQDKRAKRQYEDVRRAILQAQTEGGDASVGRAADGGQQPEDYREAATSDTEVLDDGADWYAGSDEFIAEWAPRIDEYLKGSPLEGQGINFAAAAWKYNVDPRWSPAISNTESSKGEFCIRPFNAWGWGAADEDPYNLALEWKSWEEAIDAHVKGLADGYSYTISLSDARRYCPITWQSWYNHTLGEMAKI